MRVIISGEVVNSVVGTQDARKLHQVLGHACEGRHVVVFDPPESVDAWLAQVEIGTREAYATAIGLSNRRATALPATASTVHVRKVEQPEWGDPVACLPLDDALDLLAEPLGILVENSGNDWHFVAGLMRVSEREMVSRALERGWVQVLHGGGATLRAQIEARLRSPRAALRTFVIFDSDRRHPSEHDPAWSPKGQEACTGFQFEQLTRIHMPQRYWMLQRRNIESYMPRPELEEAVSGNVHPDAIDAFFRMHDDARWYYNMRRGFRGDEPMENQHRCRDLYDGVSVEDRGTLMSGFGRVADQYSKVLSREFAWDVGARSEAAATLPCLLRLL